MDIITLLVINTPFLSIILFFFRTYIFPSTGLTFVKKKLKGVPHNDKNNGNIINHSGYLVNYGKDISPNMIEEDISICLPAELEWEIFEIPPESQSKGLKIKVEESNSRTRIIRLNRTFKNKEFLYIISRAKLGKGLDKKEYLKSFKGPQWNCRILDVSKINERIFFSGLNIIFMVTYAVAAIGLLIKDIIPRFCCTLVEFIDLRCSLDEFLIFYLWGFMIILILALALPIQAFQFCRLVKKV